MDQIRIGISGWRYAGWRGTFYPPGLAQRRELEYASRQVNSIEINGSFYSLQSPEKYKLWRETTPDDFVFSVKGSRYITHIKQLNEIETPLANFYASGVLALREKLGPFLWQFPPRMRWNEEKFRRFFSLLPHSTKEAAALAKKCDTRMEGRSYWRVDRDRPIRHAVEIRNESFLQPDFIGLLRENKIALVFADTAGKWPYAEDLTSDFVYMRLHGKEELYVSGYDDDDLDYWEARIRLWKRGAQPKDARLVSREKPERLKRDVFVYFDNDVKVRAPYDALRLLTRLTDFVPLRPMSLKELEGLPERKLLPAAGSRRWDFRKRAA